LQALRDTAIITLLLSTSIRDMELYALQAEANTAVSDLPSLSDTMLLKLQRHNWQRGFWYSGK
jgi:hypothetical protein